MKKYATRQAAPFILMGLFSVFWIVGVIDLHFIDFLFQAHSSRLLSVIDVWKTHKVSTHFYIPFLSSADFERGIPYTHYPYFYMLSTFGVLEVIGLITFQSLDVAQNFFIIIDVVLVAILIAWSLGPELCANEPLSEQRLPFRHVIIMFVSMGVVLTTPVLWLSRVIASVENFHPYGAIGLIAISILDSKNKLKSRLGKIVMFLMAILAPIYVLLYLITSVFLGPNLDRNMIDTKNGGRLFPILMAVLSIFSLCGCKLLALAAGFNADSGSDFLVRTGLDGDTKYYSSIVAAIISPSFSHDRMWHFVHYFFVILAIFIISAFVFKQMDLAGKVLRQWLIIACPYFFMCILFGQWASVHPYAIDVVLALGTAFIFYSWSNRAEVVSRLVGPVGSLWLVIGVGMLMTNLIDLARSHT